MEAKSPIIQGNQGINPIKRQRKIQGLDALNVLSIGQLTKILKYWECLNYSEKQCFENISI